MRATRLYISGGSHRAALGGLGAILYLLDSTGAFRWDSVDEVVAVSGGTQPVAALAASGASDTDEVSDTMRRLYAAIERDQLRLTTPRRMLIVTGLVLALITPLLLCGAFVFFDVAALIVYPVGLLTFAVVFRAVSWLLSVLQENYLRSIIGAACPSPELADRRLDALKPTTNLYVMVAVGLDSALMYPAWIGEAAPASIGDRAVQAISPIDACLASSSLPSLGRLRSPTQTSSGHQLLRRELLIDGGVGGNFGFQLSKQIADEIVAGTVEPSNRQVLTVDAGRRVEPSVGMVAKIRRISTVARLMRWVQVAGDATYLNDLDDMKQLGSVLGGAVDVADGLTPATTGTATSAHDPHSVAAIQLGAIDANSSLGIFDLDDVTIPLAVACGIVGSLLTDRAAEVSDGTKGAVTVTEAEHALTSAGQRLGVGSGLVTAWRRTS